MKTIITCSKGLKDEDFYNFEFEGSLSDLRISDVREKLIDEQFIKDDDDGDEQWRFVFPMVDAKKKIPYSDRIVALSTERVLPLNTIIKHNQVILTNCNLSKKSDLIGFKTDWFKNGKIKVRCQLKNDTPEHIKINADKFEPVMLTDVISTNEKKSLYYGCAIVCCEDSIVEFPVNSYGTTGINLLASINGQEVYNCCFNFGPYNYETYGDVSVNCMKWDGKTVDIKIENLTKDPSIVPGTEIEYQKFTVYTKDMLSWKDLSTGKVYDKTVKKPVMNYAKIQDDGSNTDVVTSNKVNFAQNYSFNMNFAKAEDDGRNANKTRAEEKEQFKIGGDDVDRGKVGAGDEVKYSCGNWTRGAVSDETLGAVIIYVLVFKTLDIAKKFIDMYEIGKDKDYWGE